MTYVNLLLTMKERGMLPKGLVSSGNVGEGKLH
jgi:hypothetical protein